MRFRQAHKSTTYLLVLTAVALLASAGVLPSAVLAAFAGVVVLSFWVDPGTALARWRDRLGWACQALMVLAVGAALVLVVVGDAGVGPGPVALPVLIGLGCQLLYRRVVRDDQVIQVLAFVLVAIAAWAAESVLFVVGFFAYAVVATWSLVLLHLRREIEDNYLVRHLGVGTERVTAARVLESRRVVGPGFFLVTAAAALVVLAGAALTFLIAPRFGPSAPRRKVHLTGFSTEVSLGHPGVLSDANDRVILRAKVPRLEALPRAARAHAIATSYWRGVAYDTYASGRWRMSGAVEAPRSPLPSAGEAQGEAWLPGESLDEQQIELIPLAQPITFALDPPVAWKGTDRRYTAFSRLPTAERPPAHPLTSRERALYLATPSIAARVRTLARTITTGAVTPRDKAAAITRWLHATHRYSTTLARDPRIADPVEDFLFAQTAGHCEYFASAAALLLRLADVPSRYVTGFLGGEWNEVGHYVAVRDNRAHAWVEMYVDGEGWIRIDATPSVAAAPAPGRARQLADSIDQRWSGWILDYDRDRQRALARHLPGATTVVAALVALLAAAALRRARRRTGARAALAVPTPPRAPDARPIFRLYADTLARLERHGQRRTAGETPRELAARLRASNFPGWPAFAQLTEHYVAARFAAREIPAPVLATLARELRALGRDPRARVA